MEGNACGIVVIVCSSEVSRSMIEEAIHYMSLDSICVCVSVVVSVSCALCPAVTASCGRTDDRSFASVLLGSKNTSLLRGWSSPLHTSAGAITVLSRAVFSLQLSHTECLEIGYCGHSCYIVYKRLPLFCGQTSLGSSLGQRCHIPHL